MFRKKLATPYWVTYQYNPELQNQPIHTTTHSGQEFDLVVKGAMKIRVGDHEEILHEGDSIFYKSSTPHGMIAVEGQECVFLAMIMASDTTDQPMFIARGKDDPAAHFRHRQTTQQQRIEEHHNAPAEALLYGVQIVGEQAH